MPVHTGLPKQCGTPRHLKQRVGVKMAERKAGKYKDDKRISYQCPEDVYGEEGDGKSDEANSLQSALQLQVVLGSPQAQPARDGCQGCDEKEAGHVAQQGALLAARAWVLQPLSKNKTKNPSVNVNQLHAHLHRHKGQSKHSSFSQPGGSHLCEWLWSPFNSEFCVTEFTVAGVGR